MPLALRIANKIDYSTAVAAPATGWLAWLMKDTVNFSGKEMIDFVGSQTRTQHQGRCYSFDGTDDYVEVNNSTDIQISGAFTIRVNVRPGSTIAANDMICHKIDAYGINYGFTGLGTTAGKFGMSVHNGTGWTTASSTTSFAADTHYHIVGTFDGVDTIKIYVNGTLEGTNTGFTGSINQSTTNLFVGAYDGGGYGEQLMYNFQIWDVEWTATQVTSDYDDNGAIPDTLTMSDLMLLLKMDESAGTTAYDSSGNGNDGSINNATVSTFHTTHKDVINSWQNDFGYSDGAGGVLVPRDESDTANDVTGSALDYTNRVKYNAKFVNSHCGTFDGTDDYIDIGNQGGAIKSISFWIYADDITSHTDYVIDLNGTDYITIVNGTVTINGFAAATTNIYVDNAAGSTLAAISTWYHVIITSDTAFTASDLDLARLEGFGNFGGRLADVRLFTSELDGTERTTIYNGEKVTAGLSAHYPISENSGTTIYNTAANANHGTATNVNTTNFWANTQDNFHWNITQGFRLASGVKIPSLTDNTTAADGNNNTNVAGKHHNNAETEIQFTRCPRLYNADENNFMFDGSGNAQTISYADIVQNVNSADKIFANVQTTNKKKDLLVYPAALTGDDRTLTLDFVTQ